VRDQPRPIGDPYRVLGLEPGASMADVKRAYRRLAKAYHPDSAGEAALPRFLAIHEAYERLVTGRSRAGIGPRTTRTGPTTAEPWRADPERARAARDRARTARGSTGPRADAGGAATGRSRTGTTGTTGTTGPAGTTGRASGSAGSAAGRASGADGRSGPGAREGRRRTVRKATLGSTSYDEARDATDATWSGASWYGPSSGEYWIVNPREYADPRKHGPGYQQRARKAAPPLADAATSTGTGGTLDGQDEPSDEAAEKPIEQTRVATGATDRGFARDARRWEATSRPGSAPRAEAGASAAGARDRDAGVPGDGARRDPVESLGAVGRDLLGTSTEDPIRRLGLALVAWPPIGLAAAAAIGDITGCTSYSTECAGSDALLPWLAQAAILGLLLLLPPLARLFVGGTIGVLVALIPVTAFLVVVGAGGAPQSGFALGALLAVAWTGGIAWAARDAGRGPSAERA